MGLDISNFSTVSIDPVEVAGGVGGQLPASVVSVDSGTAPAVDHTTALVDQNAWVYDQASGLVKGKALAPLASPAFTGTPTAPTATALDSSTKLATTAYADSAVAAALATGSTRTVSSTNTLSSALATGSPITSLPIAAAPMAIPSAASLVLTSGANTQTYTTSGTTAAGATSIPVNSITPNFAYPVTTNVFYAPGVSVTNIVTTDQVILVDATGGAFSMTLPTAVGFKGVFRIRSITPVGAQTPNLVTLGATGGQTIDGKSTATFGPLGSAAQWIDAEIISDGANWRTV